MAQEMDSIYENYSFIRATVGSGNFTEQQESKKQHSSPKWTKVPLICLTVSLVFALGGLVVLGILYFNVSVQLSAKETNGMIMERELDELKVNYTRVKEHLHNNKIKTGECTANYNKVKERYKVKTGELTGVKERLSFYEAFKAQSSSCDVNLAAFHGKLYFFSCDKRTWSSSRDFCVSRGGNLLTITSQQEQSFLHPKVTDWRWIGLTDVETEGRWVWVNGQTLQETGVQFWLQRPVNEKSEPDNWKQMDPSGENCALMRKSSWFDYSCKKELKFICEKKY